LLFLIDTNAFSDLMAEQVFVSARLAAISTTDKVCTSVIVRGEIFYGISRLTAGKRREGLQRRAEGLFVTITCQPISEAIADRYAAIKQDTASRGTPVAENDLWIAATVLDLNATLVTRDHGFRNIPGLVAQDWSTS
jgi:predicted nucleic acid-binding protein